MPRRRQHRNHRFNYLDRLRRQLSEGIYTPGPVFNQPIGAGVGQVVDGTLLTTYETTPTGSPLGGGGAGGGVYSVAGASRSMRPAPPLLTGDRGRRAGPDTIEHQTPGGQTITLQRLSRNHPNYAAQDALRRFIADHADFAYPPDIALVMHPDSSIQAGMETYVQAVIDGGIDHDRETKQITMVGAFAMLRSQPNYFVGAVHSDHRRQGIGRALFEMMAGGGYTPTAWIADDYVERERVAAFYAALGLVRVEDGRNATRWGTPRIPAWWA